MNTHTFQPEAQDTNSNVTSILKKTPKNHTTQLKGITAVFSSSKHVDSEELIQYLENNLTKVTHPQTLDHMLQVLHKRQHDDDAARLNNNFIEFMDLMIPLINNYATGLDHKPQEHSSTDLGCESTNETDNAEESQYKFKVPRERTTMFDKHWKEHYNELVEFKKLFGHCNASRTTKGYDSLGNWLADQRKKLRRGKMTRGQYDMLTELGVEWERSSQFVATPK